MSQHFTSGDPSSVLNIQIQRGYFFDNHIRFICIYYHLLVTFLIRLVYNQTMITAKYTKKAYKGLMRIPRPQARKMHEALAEIANGNTKGKDITKLDGKDGFRLRRGGYRAIYQTTQTGIHVIAVKPRGDAYK